ncbi:hypothetical protein GGS23DRAFT_340663 [Durotheca rogersii]|uniref:uncharacterized protein n=1 Tax=Durotheca rogersii TaxID=419775 RepID=UPI00221FF900|nr:uncharacterized protein GGS23DRAFT_340663 [Durotheca rogersii]KAI5858239.1 hypothetical protein GGS23DRAFT_340663 [Durotheca rogersii]
MTRRNALQSCRIGNLEGANYRWYVVVVIIVLVILPCFEFFFPLFSVHAYTYIYIFFSSRRVSSLSGTRSASLSLSLLSLCLSVHLPTMGNVHSGRLVDDGQLGKRSDCIYGPSGSQSYKPTLKPYRVFRDSDARPRPRPRRGNTMVCPYIVCVRRVGTG